MEVADGAETASESLSREPTFFEVVGVGATGVEVLGAVGAGNSPRFVVVVVVVVVVNSSFARDILEDSLMAADFETGVFGGAAFTGDAGFGDDDATDPPVCSSR